MSNHPPEQLLIDVFRNGGTCTRVTCERCGTVVSTDHEKDAAITMQRDRCLDALRKIACKS